MLKRSFIRNKLKIDAAVAIPVLFLVVGALTAILAWREGLLWALVVIPVAWRYTPDYVSAGAMIFAYFLVGAHDFPTIFQLFYPASGFLGYVLWMAHASLLALPYSLMHRYGAMGLVLALLVTAIPPLGLIGWLSPLLVAGEWFPGLGMAGYLLSLVTFFFLGARGAGNRLRWAALASLFLVSIYSNARAPALPNAALPQWFGQNTSYGPYPREPIEGFERQMQLMKEVDKAIDQGAKLILLPEGIVDRWQPASEYWWRKEIDLARQQKATLLIGASVNEGNGRWADVLIIRGRDTGLAKARIPVPISLWNPFAKNGFTAEPTASGISYVQGKPVAVSMCYEDLLIFPLLLSFTRAAPAAILSAANNWFGGGTDEPYGQSLSIGAQARLFGVPLIRAVNVPEAP